jgi:N-acetylneuraminic acid mutarotase
MFFPVGIFGGTTPYSNTWNEISSYPISVGGLSAVTLSNNYVIAFGGNFPITPETYASVSTSTTSYGYSVVTNSWSELANVPLGICFNGVAVLSNNSVVTVGGSWSNSGYYSGSSAYWNYYSLLEPTSNCYLYSPSANSWSAFSSYPIAATGVTCSTLLNGNVLAVGGDAWSYSQNLSTQVNYVNETFITQSCYLLNGNTWNSAASYPIPITNAGSARFPNGSVLVVGGFTNNSIATTSCYRYDPSPNTWTQVSHLPLSLGFVSCSPLRDGTVLAVGGASSKTTAPSSVTYRFTPSSNTWSNVSSCPLGAGAVGLTNLANGSVIAVTGATGFDLAVQEDGNDDVSCTLVSSVTNLGYRYD